MDDSHYHKFHRNQLVYRTPKRSHPHSAVPLWIQIINRRRTTFVANLTSEDMQIMSEPIIGPVRLAYQPPANSTFLSQNKPATAICHQPNEQADRNENFWHTTNISAQKHLALPFHVQERHACMLEETSTRHVRAQWWTSIILCLLLLSSGLSRHQ
jgi:hypothetical protein